MGSSTALSLALLQLPGMEAPDLTFSEQAAQIWSDGGWVMWPLGACAVIGLVVIVWKLIDLGTKASRTRKFLGQVDQLILERKIPQALTLARESDSPAARILAAGLERADEGSERVMKAIEAAGEVEATVVAGGIKVALITTAAGLAIAIPINIMHNYFVTRIDRLVIDMEESAQKMIDAVHAQERAAARV